MVDRVPGGPLTLAADLTLSRMGFGTMQLTGTSPLLPPEDPGQAVTVLREAVELGITHLDTAEFYGAAATNDLIRQALHPYPAGLHIATKVGARLTADGDLTPSSEPEDLKAQVRENLQSLKLETLDVVNLRLPITGTGAEPVAAQFGALAELREQGLIRHLGLSGASQSQLAEAQAIAPVSTVQNLYNLADRTDDALVDRCAAENIAYAAFFPLGGVTPLQPETLTRVATRLDASPQQVALAWLLRRSPTTVLIPGTSSVVHLHENVAAADLDLPADALAELDTIGR